MELHNNIFVGNCIAWTHVSYNRAYKTLCHVCMYQQTEILGL